MSSIDEGQAVGWLEDKLCDYGLISEILSCSQQMNWWTNFGPVSRLLETEIATILGIQSDHTVVVTSSGTTALEVLAKQTALGMGRPVRWVASAFSFLNIGCGLFADCRLVDCDSSGLLSVSALAGITADSYDGVIVTNPFGYKIDGEYLDEIARTCGKPVIVDNASGLGFPWPYDYPVAYSLHHTKPFGFGEGGAVVIPSESEPQVRALLNFGRVSDETTNSRTLLTDRSLATNGKCSDLAAAAILARLRSRARWMPKYSEQALRVSRIVTESGLELLTGYRPDDQTANAVPVVCESPVSLSELACSDGPRIAYGHYHRPLAARPVAQGLYDRIVLIPSHSDVGLLEDVDLHMAIRSLALRSRPAAA